MKRLFLTIALAAISVFGLMAEEKTKVYEFGDITSLEVGFMYQVHITEGTSGKVKVVCESDYEKHLRVTFDKTNSKLRLGLNDIPKKFKKEFIKGNQPHIDVYMEMDLIEEIMILGGGTDLYFNGRFTGENVNLSMGVATSLSDLVIDCKNLELSGSGACKASLTGTVINGTEVELSGASRCNLNITAQELECNLSGASSFTNNGNFAKCNLECSGASKFTNNGDIQDGYIECSGACALKLTGKGSRVYLEGSGACKINTKDFNATDVLLRLSGACSATVYADKSLKYSASKTSKVTYYGNAVLTNLDESENVVKGN